MPPASDNIPSPAMSVLKQYLVSNGFNVDVIYWNLLLSKLQKDFVWTNNFTNRTMLSMYLVYNYLSITCKDESAYKHLKTNLKSIKPQYIAVSYDFFDKHMKKYSNLFEKAINNYLSAVNWNDVLFTGMSVNLYQWIASSIIAKKIKDRCPDLPVIIGGIGTKESAIAYLNNFPQFDIAVWGEGENAILDIANQLKSEKCDFKNCTGVAYRNGKNILISENHNKKYVDLGSSAIQPDFSDYFRFKKSNKMNSIETEIPIEGSRGCHWNRCHFCFANEGYKYRRKPVDKILNEIKSAIQEYEIYQFHFLDNDIIGKDLNQFNQLLSSLAELKKLYPDFAITQAETITNGINEQIIKNMALAGFEHVQIGYESSSNELLKKIDKKNSFLSNLLFIKFADYYHIDLAGLNNITGLLEETDDDINEAIDNLHCLRFFLKRNLLYHRIFRLSVFHSSKYYNIIKEDIKKWNIHTIKSFIPENYIKEENDNLTLLPGSNFIQKNYLWKKYKKIEKHYSKNAYTYKIIGTGNTILYKEFFNSEAINILEFEKDSGEWLVLKSANSEVKTFDTILSDINKQSISRITPDELLEIIDSLEKESLLFCSKDKQMMVSIINTNSII